MVRGDLSAVVYLWAPIFFCALFIILALTLDFPGDFTLFMNIGVLGVDRPVPKTLATEIVL